MPGVRRLVVGLLAVGALVLQGMAWDEPAAVAYAEQTFQRALVAFGIARGINAAVSVLQESEVRFGVGVGAGVKPGQVLDPVNDLVERFSWVMLVTSIAAFMVKLLSELMLGAEALLVLAALMALSLILLWPRIPWLARVGDGLFRLTSVVALAFLAITLMPLAANLFHGLDRVNHNFETSREALTTATHEVKGLAEAAPPPGAEPARAADGEEERAADGAEATPWQDTKRFFGERLPRFFDERRMEMEAAASHYLDKLDMGQRLERFQRMAEELPEQVVVQIAVFVMEVFLIPLLVLWLGYRVIVYQWGGRRRFVEVRAA
ncbi:MAG: hypothetical protein U5S82_24765 [Gammaproteobacteria bacterium]|nr:hypothetical protein [Gammaproteobacteria bacterium]